MISLSTFIKNHWKKGGYRMGVAIPLLLLGTASTIDAATLLYYKGVKGKKIEFDKSKVSELDVNVIIPVYNEEEMIGPCIESLFSQSQSPKFVIVVDDCSQDKTQEICMKLREKYSNLVYIRMPKNYGKAHNLNYVVQNLPDEFHSKITLTVDSDVMLAPDFIEQIKKPFSDKKVGAASGTVTIFDQDPTEKQSFLRKIINRTYNLLFSSYSFNKTAQNFRKAVNPLCGGCVAFRTEILKKTPIPQRTKTEDTDYTWILHEQGYDVIHFTKAMSFGEEAKSIKSFFRQWFRWYSGTAQCIYVHGEKLLKSKRLFFSTIIPSQIDTLSYVSLLLLSMLFIFSRFDFVIIGLLIDFGLTAAMAFFFYPRALKYLPFVWLMKIVVCVAWVTAAVKTAWEYLNHKQYLWSNKWGRRSNL